MLNNDLQKLKEWANKWHKTFNPLETEVMLISNIFHDYDFHLFYDNALLNDPRISRLYKFFISTVCRAWIAAYLV